jgi:GSCFA family
MMRSPYSDRPKRSFWRTGVAERHPLELGDVYLKKFAIGPEDRIAVAGSCFAQHVMARLRSEGYQVVDAEPAPYGVGHSVATAYGFELYSARYGNIYTPRQLLQLVQESRGRRSPADPVWEKDGRYFDALRPSIEPRGLPTRDLVLAHRREHLKRVGWALKEATILIFTLGLTEAWAHRRDGTVYPTAPGTIAGTYDENIYEFKNFSHDEVVQDLIAVRKIFLGWNPTGRIILTVSPVPLAATASGEHVLSATMYSKSVLRAAAGYMAAQHADVDYFPAYEIVAGAQSRGIFYDRDLRRVSAAGVDAVMRVFFAQHGLADGGRAEEGCDTAMSLSGNSKRLHTGTSDGADWATAAMCDEELLEAFS